MIITGFVIRQFYFIFLTWYNIHRLRTLECQILRLSRYVLLIQRDLINNVPHNLTYFLSGVVKILTFPPHTTPHFRKYENFMFCFKNLRFTCSFYVLCDCFFFLLFTHAYFFSSIFPNVLTHLHFS